MSDSKPSAERPADGSGTGRCPVTGRFTAGNSVGLRHGARSQQHIQRLKEQARDAIAEQRGQIVTDLGGAEELSRIQADLVERYLTASCLLGWMEAELVKKGPLTSKGSRRALHSVYVQQLDRVVRLGSMLGLERKATRVPSLEEVMAGD